MAYGENMCFCPARFARSSYAIAACDSSSECVFLLAY